MTEATEDVKFVDGDQLKGDAVEKECRQGAEIAAGELNVGMLNEQRDDGVADHPTVHGPVWHVRHRVLLEMNGHLSVEIFGVDAEQLVEPVEERPL